MLKFCPKCHRKVEIPEIAKQAEIKGQIKIMCGNCKDGVVIINNKEKQNVT